MPTPKGYEYAQHGKLYVRTSETCWPRSDGEDVDELAHRLRYGPMHDGDSMAAASFVDAWRAFVWKPRHIREAVIRAVREAEHRDTATSSQIEEK